MLCIFAEVERYLLSRWTGYAFTDNDSHRRKILLVNRKRRLISPIFIIIITFNVVLNIMHIYVTARFLMLQPIVFWWAINQYEWGGKTAPRKKKKKKNTKNHPKHKFSFTPLYILLISNMKNFIQILKNCLKINLFGNKNAYWTL